MRGFQQLAPVPSTQPASRTQPSEVTDSLAGKKRKRHTLSKQEWDELRDTIVQTYADHTLKETIDIVKERCGFEASSRQYKKMLDGWGVDKHYPKDVLHFIVEKRLERERQGKETVVLLNGAEVDFEAIEKFRTRQQYPSQASRTSPPKVTPKGLEYFTPQTPLPSGEWIYATPRVFTPLSKLSAFALRNFQDIKADPTALAILRYDTSAQKVRLIKAVLDGGSRGKAERARLREEATEGELDQEINRLERRARRKALSQEVSQKKPHTHYVGEFAVTGNRRFEGEDLLKFVLWSSRGLADEVYGSVHKRTTDEIVALTLPAGMRNKEEQHPEYHLYTESDCDVAVAAGPLVSLLRHNKLIQRILGFSRKDASRWIGPWAPMTQEKAFVLNSTANHLFGDPAKFYPNMPTFVVLVHFTLGGSQPSPLLLRISFATPEESSDMACSSCDNLPMVLDYISHAGTLKMRTSATTAFCYNVWQRLEDLTHDHRLESTVFFSKWYQTAYLAQGLLQARHVRQCYCNGTIHKAGFRQHFIDMQKELEMKDENWCPNPSSVTGEDFFHTFPGDDGDNRSILIIENPDVTEWGSDEEHWDPLDVAGSQTIDDSFEPDPSEDEAENRYLSRPIYPRSY